MRASFAAAAVVTLLATAACVGDRVRGDADAPAGDARDAAAPVGVTQVVGTAGAAGAADSAAIAADSATIAGGASRPSVAPPAGARVVPVATPDAMRGLYLNAWAAGSTKKLAKLIGIADQTEINTFVIDLKEGGEISYRSSIALANEIGAAQPYIREPRVLLQKMRDAGIYPIARIVVFKDEKLATAKPEWAIVKADGSLWKDRDGNIWVDSFNKKVWDYNIAIAKEAVEMGFAEVQWDYVRFPDVPPSLMKTAVWPERKGRSKEDAIREFLLYSREQLAPYKVPVTADVFGLTVSVKNDLGIGQQWEKMLNATDALLPMVYPSHYVRGSYGVAHPNASPYAIVKKAMDFAVKRSAGVANAAEIRPWLQDFTLGAPRYTAAHVRAQIKATHDAGLNDWILWNPGSNYTVAALASKDGTPPDLRLPSENTTAPKAAGPKPATPPVKRDSVRPDSVRPDSVRPPKPDTIGVR